MIGPVIVIRAPIAPIVGKGLLSTRCNATLCQGGRKNEEKNQRRKEGEGGGRENVYIVISLNTEGQALRHSLDVTSNKFKLQRSSFIVNNFLNWFSLGS